jgi:hypothetical protein
LLSVPGVAGNNGRVSTAPPSLPSAEQVATTAGLTSAAVELGKAAEALHGLIELAEMTGRSGRTGKTDLN